MNGTMSENPKNNTETDDGDVARVFACKPYGWEFTAIRTVVLISCMKNLISGGMYSLARQSSTK